MNKNTLLFVYNADSTLFASLGDFARKLMAPQTYTCNLCAVTYGLLNMKGEWKAFLDTLPYQKIFLHRDEFVEKHPAHKDIPLPAIFIISGGSVNELVSAREMNKVKDIAGLRELLLSRLGNYEYL